ncbi:NlpC/P60 family protein [Marivivens niveibacter]|nr:NlpC/P60 family protein [Marivivens niveibacter]
MDRRRTAANGRVAATELKGVVAAEHYSDGSPAWVSVPVADLLDTPDGKRDRQLIAGTPVRVYDTIGSMHFVQSLRDGYVGYLKQTQLSPAWQATHRVAVTATHAFRDPDIKSPDLCRISYGAQLTVFGIDNKMAKTPLGFVPEQMLGEIDKLDTNPSQQALKFVGVPYLWGGNSADGIDCSGLVQMALQGCGIDCPGDSDMQRDEVGTLLPPDTPTQSGDLFFWPGHVAMAVDQTRIVHANAHHMAVTVETIEIGFNRMGQPTHHRRP